MSLSLLLVVMACDGHSTGLDVREAWVRPVLPTQSVTAAYFDLANRGRETVRVTGASSPAFDAVEIHEMATDAAGVMRMRRLGSLVIEPGETIHLRPGAKHLMLIGPRHPLSEGNDVPIVLQTEDGHQVTFAARIREARR